jgi:tetratricopeptide (TPR) repeat protein
VGEGRLHRALLGEFPRWSGRHERAVEVRTEGVALARKTDDADLLATLLDDMAWSLGALGRHHAANATLEEAWQLRESRPDDFLGSAHTLAAIAWQRIREGNANEALELVVQVRDHEARDNQAPTQPAETSDLEATALLAAGRMAEADELYREVFRLSRELDFRITMLDALVGLATIQAERDAEQATRRLGMADRVRADSGIEVFDVDAYGRLRSSLRDALGAVAFDELHAAALALPLAAIQQTALDV